jgi:biopolymer transport protein TolQ
MNPQIPLEQTQPTTILGLLANADFVVQIVVIMLLIASVISWSIIIDKFFKFRQILSAHRAFETTFRSGAPLLDLFSRIKDFTPTCVLEKIFIITISEWQRSKSISLQDNNAIKDLISAKIALQTKRTVESYEKNLPYLATIASSAPFIGLFGTTWGIMNNFQAIMNSKNTSLVVVAPGIAEALFATALGLIAAIPAYMFYNILTSKISEIEKSIENFCMEISSIVFFEIDKNQ